MQPEIKQLLKIFDDLSHDCQDALIASWGMGGVDKQLIMNIYEKKDKERARVAKELSRLCQIK